MEPDDPTESAVELDGAWGVDGNLNGGYLMGLLCRAALQRTGAAAPHVLSASFLHPARHGPARLRVETLHSGRTAVHALAVLRQEQRTVVHASVLLGATPGPSTQARPPFTLPPEPECLPLPPHPAFQGLLDLVRVSYQPGYGPRDPAPDPGAAVVRAWVRLSSGEHPDLMTALLATDVLVPSIARLGHRGWAPTVQMTVHLHHAPAPGPLAVEVVAGEIRDGWFDEEATVLDADGALVARARQLARLPR